MAPVFGHGRLRLYLLTLLDESPRHGYELIRLLEDRFLGLYAPSAGTIYPRLARLEAEGLVTHSEDGGRKVYRLTEAGQAELRDRGADLAELEAEIRDSVRGLARQIGAEVRETARDLRDEIRRAADPTGSTDPAGSTGSARSAGPTGSTVAGRRRRQPGWQSFLSYLEQRGAPADGTGPAVPAGVPGGVPGGVRGGVPEAPEGDAVTPAGESDAVAFERRLQDFRDTARDLVHEAVRDGRVSPAQVRECAEILSDALERVRSVLGRRS